MSELLLSARRLSLGKTLQTGKLNVLKTLEQYRDLDIVTLGECFNNELELEWKEVVTPDTPASYRDLVGKKLSEYKFQYLGRFLVDGKPVEVQAEQFSTRLRSEEVTNNKVENEGWVNCTWLLDFLMRAKNIQQDSTAKEFLSVYNKGKHIVIELHRDAIDQRSSEQERFLFSKDLKELTWEHELLFV